MAHTLGDWLQERPFQLALSSGFFGFFSHAGLIAALEDAGLHPAGITGSSAGALTGGLWSAGLDASVLRHELSRLRRSHFWDPFPGQDCCGEDCSGESSRASCRSIGSSSRVCRSQSACSTFSRGARA